MPVTSQNAKQNVHHQSTSSAVSIDENGDVLAQRSGREPNNGPFLERNNNPLSNDLVLTTLFENVKGNYLKECRLVCKQWAIQTIPAIRTQFQVKIGGPTTYLNTGGPARRIANFMELIDSNTFEIPFGKFFLGVFDTTQGLGHQFLQTCGNAAKEIILDCNCGEDHAVETIADILKRTPKLESFTFPKLLSSRNGEVTQLFPGPENEKPKLSSLKSLTCGLTFYGSNDKKLCPTFNEELLEAAENISTLDLTQGSDWNICSDILKIIEKLGRESMIENLTISFVNEEHLEILHRMFMKPNGIKLKHIDLEEVGRNGHFVSFDLVDIFKDTLASVRIICDGDYVVDSLVTLPYMPKLKCLHLKTLSNATLSCDDVKNNFPVLEKLYLDFPRSLRYKKYYNIILNGEEPCPTYETSTIDCVPINMENLNRTLIIFPTLNILKCKITMDDGVEVMKKIFTDMAHLEGLSIYGNLPASQNLDSLMTGMSVTKLDKMDDFFKSLQNEEIADRKSKIQEKLTFLNKNSELPSIRNLTNLRDLSLKLNRGDTRIKPDNYLTDSSAFFGFYSLKNLKHLHIADCELTKSCCKILTKDNDLINWEFISPWPRREIIPTVRNEKTPLDGRVYYV